jgi:hypothetical protein
MGVSRQAARNEKFRRSKTLMMYLVMFFIPQARIGKQFQRESADDNKAGQREWSSFQR